jgi:hypothetical protein
MFNAGLNSNHVEGFDSIYSQQLEKFAELIVRECADLMNSNKDSDMHVMWNRALYETRGKIFRHFGVEE